MDHWSDHRIVSSDDRDNNNHRVCDEKKEREEGRRSSSVGLSTLWPRAAEPESAEDWLEWLEWPVAELLELRPQFVSKPTREMNDTNNDSMGSTMIGWGEKEVENSRQWPVGTCW